MFGMLERKILRGIYKTIEVVGVWWTHYNFELNNLFKDVDTVEKTNIDIIY